MIEGGHDFLLIGYNFLGSISAHLHSNEITKRRVLIIRILYKHFHPAGQSHTLLNSFGWVYNQPTTPLFKLLAGTTKYVSKTVLILSRSWGASLGKIITSWRTSVDCWQISNLRQQYFSKCSGVPSNFIITWNAHSWTPIILKVNDLLSNLGQNHIYAYWNLRNTTLIYSIRVFYIMLPNNWTGSHSEGNLGTSQATNTAATHRCYTHSSRNQPSPPSISPGGNYFCVKRYPDSQSPFHHLPHSNPPFFENFLLSALPFLCQSPSPLT